jgi:hypothetical protein
MVEFDTDPSYMTVYNTISLFDYDHTSTSILGLCFYGPLPKQTSRVLIQWALVVISLTSAEEQVDMFFHAASHDERFSVIHNTFTRSIETISPISNKSCLQLES